MATLKAYFVYERDNELNNDFVKASTSGKAKMKSYMAYDLFGVDNPVVDLNVRRVSYLDDKPFTTPNILKAGYSAWCDYPQCEHVLYNDNDTYHTDGKAYCKTHAFIVIKSNGNT
jgi:hypothetical protein